MSAGTPQARALEALADFEGWDPAITTLIQQADSLGRWTLLLIAHPAKTGSTARLF